MEIGAHDNRQQGAVRFHAFLRWIDSHEDSAREKIKSKSQKLRGVVRRMKG